MAKPTNLWERPKADEIYMIAGWRQWADAGSISSGLPQYLIRHTGAHQIGSLQPEGCYLFQIPGTHDLVRPVVKFEEGLPKEMQTNRNELFYTAQGRRGLVIFLGDEPHLNIDGYVQAFLSAAAQLGVRRIVGLGGVYGELPYDKERSVGGIYSLPHMKPEISRLGVELSNYHGGASIGSAICHQARQQAAEFVAFYGFVPMYDFSQVVQTGNTIRIENDFMAWHGIMQRVRHMLKLDMDLSDLERKQARLIEVLDAKVAELEEQTPQLNVREYLRTLSEKFTEVPFDPLDDIWEDELRRLFDKYDEAE